jgi:hypothetical protein
MSSDYTLEKTVWDDGDFDRMGWHDATIHGIAFGPGDFELCLDIDYIFRWVHPRADEEHFRFWVSPCTIVFANAHDVQLQADPYGGPLLSIDEITREDPRRPKNAEFVGRDTEWRWTLGCHYGEISFRAVGFTQYVRRAPRLAPYQTLELEARGGYGFGRSFEGGS